MAWARRASVGLLAVVAGVAACERDSTPKPVPPWHQESGYRWRELVVERGKPGFTRMEGPRSGIDFENAVAESSLVANRVIGQGAGIALGDVDGDGLVDVFLGRSEGCSALYRNLGGWRFEDVTKTAGVGACGRNTTGVAFADFDGDGDLDLVQLATRGPNAVFVNDGKGHFTERHDTGLDTLGKGGTTLTMADVDGDGLLDLYVANYKSFHIDDSIPPQRRGPNQLVRQVGPKKYEVTPEFRDYYKLVNRPDMGGLRITTRGEPDEFYVNKGGRFRRVPLASARFRDASGKPLAQAPESFSLDARFADLNGDGAPDLYVANDFEDADELWFNDGRGNFRLADWRSQRQISNAAMGVDVGDVNGDGLPDLFEVDMLANDSRRLRTQIPTHTPLPKQPGDIETQLQQQRNALFVNRGDGTFSDVSMLAGVQASGWSWGTMFLDVDLDGWQDILIANGHLWDIMDADVQEGLQSRFSSADWRRFRWQFPPLRLRNVAYRNRGDLTFEDVSSAWRFGTEEDISHTMAAADLDGDGDMDVVVNRLGSPALVLRNDSPAPRVAVRLVGDAPNTQAVGATITLLGGAAPLQQREVAVGGLYMSHSDTEASFAMGKSDTATLVVRWRNGTRTQLRVVKNRVYEVKQPKASDEKPDAGTDTSTHRDGVSAAGRPADAASLFVDASAQLGGHRHVDPLFDDWQRQFLLPNSLSQLGPGVAWFDYDRDGDEDLFVGAGKGGRLAVFRNDGGRLVPVHGEAGPLASADFTTVLGLPDPLGARILMGVSSWEGQTAGGAVVPSAVSASISNGRVSANAQTLTPPVESASGPLALGDYDGDGDLDLFVGGRAIAGRYPVKATSLLFRNDSGKFTLDASQAEVLDRVGLVSAAMFADVNGDGHPDLVLAREWDSLLLLLNDGRGHFAAAPDSWGLGRWTSRWNGVAAGDLDGDGRMDIVATSWGRNTMFAADSASPLVLLHGAFGSGGEEEMLLARNDPRLRGALAPLNGYARVRTVMPELPSRVRTFADYADASVDTVLGPWKNRVARASINTLDHMVFLNRGGRFEARSLPTEAQEAPAFYAGIADFDGDGNEDVFLSQNFSPTTAGLPRYDAGRGLLLRGDGNGALEPMAGTRSGILVYGDQRGAAYADFDADGRLDLVVSQNAAATKLLHNRGAKPGLRVRLRGPASNPDGIGAQVRVVFGERMGPVREVQAGSGYWSENGAVQVFGLSATPTAVWVRWPGGTETRVPVPVGAREVSVAATPR